MITISESLISLGVTNFILTDEPKSAQEFQSFFKAVIGVDDKNSAILSNDANKLNVTWEQIVAEKQRLQDEYDAKEYQRQRAKEYPPITNYLDGLVKGDQEQMQEYIDACLAVKAKYPKPE
jgi:hypothetical protein